MKSFGNIAFSPINCFGYDVLYLLQKKRKCMNIRNMFSYGQFDTSIDDETAHMLLLQQLENYENFIKQLKTSKSLRKDISTHIEEFRKMKNWLKILDFPFYNHLNLKYRIPNDVYASMLVDPENFNVDVFTLYSNYDIKCDYVNRLVEVLQRLSKKKSRLAIFMSGNIETDNEFVDVINLKNKIYFRYSCPDNLIEDQNPNAWWHVSEEDMKTIAAYFGAGLEDLKSNHFSLYKEQL